LHYQILDFDLNQVSAFLDVGDVIKPFENIYVEEQHQLMILLHKYEHLFDVTLGEINMEPISLQLIDPFC
jgi:sugar diacid utilization regulator